MKTVEYQSFEQLMEAARALKQCRRVALAGADDLHALEAVIAAEREKICIPVLVGRRAAVCKALGVLGADATGFDIVDSGEGNPAETAVRCVREGKADFLMKGGISSRDMLRPMVDKNSGLQTGNIMTSVAMAQLPNYRKLIVNVDGGVIIDPDLEQKKRILMTTVALLRRMGYDNPKIAVLCGVETVNPKMSETLDAAKLVQMNRSGELSGCTVVGPISYDLIFSRESAEIKRYECPYCGDFDVILSPTLAAGNILTKSWEYTAGAKWAGVIAGAKVPAVLTSRGSSAEEKFYSLALAALSSEVRYA